VSWARITSLTHGSAWDPCWTDKRDRLLIEAADALHDSAGIGEDLWHRLTRVFSDEQLLDLLMLAGWYHAISFTANGARVTCEDGAPRFADVLSGHGRSGDGPPWQATVMTDDKPEPTVTERATAAVDEFMATVLRHLRTGQGSPLEELGLQKAADELQHWRPDIPGAGAAPE